MPIAERSTHQLHYELRGPEDAPPVLLIMGLSFSSRAWHTLPEKLARSFRVITFDNAGSGRSTAPRSLTIARMADDAAAVLDAAGIARASVFGISMGGMIAIELALRHAARIDRLVLGATHANFRKSKKPALATQFMLGSVMMFRTWVSHARMARFLTSEEHYLRDKDGFAEWLAATEPSRLPAAIRQMLAIWSHAADDRIAELRIPTLVLSGDRDLLVPVENSRKLAGAISGAQLIEYPGVGHCFPVERPDEVLGALEKFLSIG